MSKVDLKVDWATRKAAEYACKNWHYSKCLPCGKLVMVGVWEDDKFVGVVLFGRGATPNLGKPYGLGQDECVELVRIALTEHKSFVSKIMVRAIKMLKTVNPGIRLIVSFADVSQGHNGAIYQAANWIYSGQGDGANFYKIKGKVVHPRSIGAKGFVQNLQGAKKIDKAAEVFRVPGKHRYLMSLDKKMRKQILPLAKPYPKRPAEGSNDGSTIEWRFDSDPDAPNNQGESR